MDNPSVFAEKNSKKSLSEGVAFLRLMGKYPKNHYSI
jgi:hypothetical protein